jgi:hypothetical protein
VLRIALGLPSRALCCFQVHFQATSVPQGHNEDLIPDIEYHLQFSLASMQVHLEHRVLQQEHHESPTPQTNEKFSPKHLHISEIIYTLFGAVTNSNPVILETSAAILMSNPFFVLRPLKVFK